MKDENRVEKFTIRLTPEQMEHIRVSAFNERITKSTYVFNLIQKDMNKED